MTFKEQLNQDLEQVFFNSDEFAELHIINGHKIEVIVDNDRLKEKSKKEYDGLYIGELLIMVPVNRIPFSIQQDMPIIFDGRQMYVFDVKVDMGMYEIVLNQNTGGLNG